MTSDAPVSDAVERCRFGGLEIDYDSTVLTPRAWTLEQSGWAAELSGTVRPGRILELCSGAGHIGLEAARRSGRALVQVDASDAACRFAAANAQAAGLAPRCEVRRADLREVDLGGERFPLVLADPPYLPSADLARFPADPTTAIDGGADGLQLLIACLLVIDDVLDVDGVALLQLRGAAQAEQLGRHLPAGLVPHELREHDTERAVLAVVRRPG